VKEEDENVVGMTLRVGGRKGKRVRKRTGIQQEMTDSWLASLPSFSPLEASSLILVFYLRDIYSKYSPFACSSLILLYQSPTYLL